jgi:outer membrane lipoprotein SlyB
MKMRKLNTVAFALGTAAVVLTGCVNPDGTPNNTGSGALGGAAIGAASGAIIGGRNAGAGALIGGAIGAITGGLIGSSMDEQQREYLRQQAPQTYVRVEQNQPLAVADVKALAQAKVSDDLIISQIRASHTVYHLSVADIIDLRNSGVSEKVIDFMINTPSTIGGTTEVSPGTTTVVSESPPPAPADTVVVAPGPDYVWIDGEWIWNGRWVWRAGYWSYPPYPHAIWIRGYWHRGPYGWRRAPGHWR